MAVRVVARCLAVLVRGLGVVFKVARVTRVLRRRHNRSLHHAAQIMEPGVVEPGSAWNWAMEPEQCIEWGGGWNGAVYRMGWCEGLVSCKHRGVSTHVRESDGCTVRPNRCP